MSTPPPPMPLPPQSMEPAQPALSEPQRLIDTFIAPSKTFTDIRRNASWWVPFVLSSIVAIAFWVTLDKKVGFDEIARKTMANSSQFQQATPEQQERIMNITRTSIKVTGYVSPLFLLVGSLIIAAVLMAAFNFGMGAEVPFSRALAIVFYSSLVNLVGTLIAFASILFGDPEGFNLQNPAGTNIAYYMDQATTSKFVYSFLTGFDVIVFWVIFLLGLGFSLNAKKKVSTSSAVGLVAVLFFVMKLALAGLASLRR